MTEESKSGLNEEEIARLLQQVGARDAPPADVSDRVRANVEQAWRESLTERRQKRRVPFAAAAAVTLMATASWFVWTRAPEPEMVVNVDYVSEALEYRSDDGDWRRVEDGSSPGRGAYRTAAGYAALALADGTVIRMAADTQIDLFDSSMFELDRGAAYIDTNRAEGDSAVSVMTRFGVARDIGTRFEVRLDDDAWRVQVRDGIVVMQDDGVEHRAGAGERLRISTENELSRSLVAANDASWEWTQAAADAFAIEGATLTSYLEWFSAETGSPVRFQSQAIGADAKRTILHGSIDGLRPAESLDVVLATTDFRRIGDDQAEIVIGR